MSPALAVAGVIAGGVVAQVVLAAVMGWGGPMSAAQRFGLCATAAGLVGAGVGRALQQPVGWFDVLFLGGLSIYLAANYGAAILKRADTVLDGVGDVMARDEPGSDASAARTGGEGARGPRARRAVQTTTREAKP